MSVIDRIPLLCLVVALGCAVGDEGDEGRDWTTTRATAGDTTVVRTTGGSDSSGLRTVVAELSIGSVDATAPEYSIGAIAEMDVGPNGEIYAFDRLAPALRMYDTAGRFVRNLGQKGSGPGEYERANGLAVHDDGRVALWDGSTARINIYSPAGEFVSGWALPGGTGSFTNRGLFVDTAGFTYARSRIADPPPGPAPGIFAGPTQGLLKWTREGRITDSLASPVPPLEGGRLTASNNGAVIILGLPFAPAVAWTWSPHGYMVTANTGSYAITLHRRTGGPLRIERDVAPVAVQDEERANHEEVVTSSLRRVEPTWRWTGQAIPGTKPFFQTVRVARDGRIWVMVSQRGEPIPEADLPPRPPAQSFDAPNAPPRAQLRWREPVAYDVFEPDGEFLGRVAIPRRTNIFVMRGDNLWGITRDSLDVEQITRFRVSPGFVK
jgi:hypothetical protein